MVHVVNVLEASAGDLQRTGTLLRQQRDWIEVESGVWLVATNLAVDDLRNWLAAHVPEIRVIILRLEGSWATFGDDAIANWLRNVRRSF